MKILKDKEYKQLVTKIDDVSKQLEQSKAADKQMELKGYLEASKEVNKFFEQQYRNVLRLVDFGVVNKESYVKAYQNNAIIFGVVKMISDSFSELSQYVEVLDSKDEVQLNHWALSLFERPNDMESGRAFAKAWAVNRLLHGEAFIYKDNGVGKFSGQVKGMYIMPSYNVDIVLGDKFQVIRGYKVKNYPAAGNTHTMDTKEVIFSREYNPTIETLRGLSPLQAAANMLQLVESADKRQNTSLVNGGVNTIVTPKPDSIGTLTPEEKEVFEQESNSKGGGFNMFWKVPLEMHKVGDTAVDLAILETSKYAINALCFVYGLSIDLFLGQAKYNNTKEAKKGLYEQAAIPLFNQYLEDLNLRLGFEKGMKFSLNTDKIEVLRKDATEMLNTLTLMNASINEKREFMGYEAVPDEYANKPMIPINYMFGDFTEDINENI